MKLSRVFQSKKVLSTSIIAMLLVGVAMVNVTSASPDTHFWVNPPVKTGVSPGSLFGLQINIAEAPSTYAWEVILSWDPGLLELYRPPPTPPIAEGTFLKAGGSTDFVYTPLDEANAKGEILIHCSLIGNISIGNWPTGNGILCMLAFTVESSGSTLLNLEDTRLWDHIGGDGYPASTAYRNEDCFFYNVSPSHDLRITDIAAPSEVGVGDVADIDVTVLNEGTETESFSLTVYADGTSIGTTTVVGLPGTGDSEARSFTYELAWDTTGVATGTYTISASVPPVSGEVDTADNTLIDGTVEVLAPPDLSIISVTPLKTTARVGELVQINVEVMNEGPKPEVFDIIVFGNYPAVITAAYGKAVAPGATTVVGCYWPTWSMPAPGPAAEGTYIITAYVLPLPGEVDLYDNMMTDGAVNITYPCKLRDWELKVNGKAGTGKGHKSTVGATNTLDAWVINNGPGNHSVWVKFIITDDVGNVVAVVTATTYPATLIAGESTVLTGSWTATEPGIFYITAMVFYGPVLPYFPTQFPWPIDFSLTQSLRVDTLPT